MLPVKNNQSWLPEIFSDFFDNDWMTRTKATEPAINVKENEKSYIVELAAPGMVKDDFNISIDDENNLVIRMEKKQETETPKNERYWRHEFNYSKFQQAISLPDNIEKKNISAKMENGVLTLTLPKVTEEEKAKLHQVINID